MSNHSGIDKDMVLSVITGFAVILAVWFGLMLALSIPVVYVDTTGSVTGCEDSSGKKAAEECKDILDGRYSTVYTGPNE